MEDLCQLSLKDLQLDYLDLYLVHTPLALTVGTRPTAITDDCKLGYDADHIGKVWEVRCYILLYRQLTIWLEVNTVNGQLRVE